MASAAILALALLACVRNAPSGDILRGGATSSGAPTGAGAGGRPRRRRCCGSKHKATDRLARTDPGYHLGARHAEYAAPAAAAARPNVPNGLVTGGLKVATGANANWTGAKAPQQQGSDGLHQAERIRSRPPLGNLQQSGRAPPCATIKAPAARTPAIGSPSTKFSTHVCDLGEHADAIFL